MRPRSCARYRTVDGRRMFYRMLWLPDSNSFVVGATDVDKVSLWQVPVSGELRKLELGTISPSAGIR